MAAQPVRAFSPIPSGQLDGTADRRVPDPDREKYEQRGEREILRRAPATDDNEKQEHRGGRHEREVEHEEQAQCVQMTLCSLMRSPRRNRSYARGVMSNEVRPSTMSSAIASPVAGACMMPCPENPAAHRNPSRPGTAPRIGCLSGVSS